MTILLSFVFQLMHTSLMQTSYSFSALKVILTPEQQERMRLNRERALAKRRAAQENQTAHGNTQISKCYSWRDFKSSYELPYHSRENYWMLIGPDGGYFFHRLR